MSLLAQLRKIQNKKPESKPPKKRKKRDASLLFASAAELNKLSSLNKLEPYQKYELVNSNDVSALDSTEHTIKIYHTKRPNQTESQQDNMQKLSMDQMIDFDQLMSEVTPKEPLAKAEQPLAKELQLQPPQVKKGQLKMTDYGASVPNISFTPCTQKPTQQTKLPEYGFPEMKFKTKEEPPKKDMYQGSIDDFFASPKTLNSNTNTNTNKRKAETPLEVSSAVKKKKKNTIQKPPADFFTAVAATTDASHDTQKTGFATLLSDYCKSLDIDYHSSNSQEVAEYINDANTKQKADSVMLVSGPGGCGKTFVIETVCQKEGYEVVYIDGMGDDLQDQITSAVMQGPDPLGPYRTKKVRVVVVDAIDYFETPAIRKIINFVSEMVIGKTIENKKTKKRKGGKSKKKDPYDVQMCSNPVIFTCSNLFAKKVMSVKKDLNPTIVKVNPLDSSQRISLARKCCQYLGIPFSQMCCRICNKSGDDMTSILTKIQWYAVGGISMSLEQVEKDKTHVGIFEACKYLLDPPMKTVYKPDQEWDETVPMPLEEYLEMWKRGGNDDRLREMCYHSFHDYVSLVIRLKGDTVEEKKNNAQRYAPSKLLKGLEEYGRIVDAYSVHDLVDTDAKHVMDTGKLEFLGAFDMYVPTALKTNLQGIRVRTKIDRGTIDYKTRYPQSRLNILKQCGINDADKEKLDMVNVMQKIEEARRMADITYIPNEKMKVEYHMGKYLTLMDEKTNTFMYADSFMDYDEEAEVSNNTKKKKGRGRNLNGRMECAKMIRYKYDLPESEMQIEVKKLTKEERQEARKKLVRKKKKNRLLGQPITNS